MSLTKAQARKLTDQQIAEVLVDLIETKRTDGYKGIHSVFSGANDLLRYSLHQDDPVAVTKRLDAAKLIEVRPARRGAMLYKVGEAPAKGADRVARASKVASSLGTLERLGAAV